MFIFEGIDLKIMICMHKNLYYEPVQILGYLECDKSEMDDEQLAFLCGLIKQYRPKKIVEVGVAAGGTTAVILQCIKMLNYDAQMVSLDLNNKYYRDLNKKTGYLIDDCKKIIDDINHTLLTGKYAVEYIENIGSDVDFLILDTVHALPGELLDFLAFYPFLTVGGVVVLHDISLCHCSSNLYAFANKVLLDTVVADKIIHIDKEHNFPGMGAFVITEDTGKYIGDLFSALALPWIYMPQDRELHLYRKFYENHYTKEYMLLFDMAVKLNMDTVKKRALIKKREFIGILEQIRKLLGRSVYIYGCGEWGKRFYTFFKECRIELKGYIISDGKKKPDLDEKVYYLSEVSLDDARDVIYIGVAASLQDEICIELHKKNFYECMRPNNFTYSFIETII